MTKKEIKQIVRLIRQFQCCEIVLDKVSDRLDATGLRGLLDSAGAVTVIESRA